MRRSTGIFLVGMAVLVVGCGSGSVGDLTPLTDSGGERTVEFGSLTTRIAGTAQPPVTSGGSGATITGIAGATITSMAVRQYPADLNKTKIVFYSSRDGNNELYTMNADGTGVKRLTFTPQHSESNPSWSPDGTKIAFSTNRRNGNWDVWVMNADGSNPVNLILNHTDNAKTDSRPTWSPDGTKIAFQSWRNNDQADLYVMNADGSNPTPITTHAANDTDPDWSPDGSKIVFVRKPSGGTFDIYTVSATGGNEAQLTSGANEDVYPTWSPDGRRIAFSADRGAEPSFETNIYVMNADGSGLVPLTLNDFSDADAHWSPDGSKILFTRYQSGVESFYTMNSDGSNQTQLTSPNGEVDLPRWSWATIRARTLVGAGGAMATEAAGFLYGRKGDDLTSLLVFDTPATKRANARVATTTGIVSGASNYSFTLTNLEGITALSFTNDLYASPTVVIGAGGLAAASSVLVDYNAATGKVIAVLPFEANRASENRVQEQDGVRLYRGSFLGVWNAEGKNIAPRGAKTIEVNVQTNAVRVLE